MSAGVKDSEAEAFDFSIAVVSLILTLLWALNSSYECIKAKYCLQMYNIIVISQFPRNLIIIYQFLSFFSLFFQFFNFGHFRTIFYPPDPWGTQAFLAMVLDLSQEPLRCPPASKNCFMITFFCLNSTKTLIWSFSLFWGILGASREAGSHVGVPRKAAHGPKLQYISPHEFFLMAIPKIATFEI